MKLKRFLIAVLAIILLLQVAVPFASAEGEDGSKQLAEGEIYQYDPVNGFPILNKTSVQGSVALLCSLDSDMILYAKEIDSRIAPASLAKIMTSMVAFENSSLDDMVTINSTAFNNLEYDWSGLVSSGDTLSMKDMLYLIMLPSANEACNAVAEYISGSVEAFCDLMNQRALELGCTGTHFSNTHGKDDENEYTTARDLMIITKAALRYPELEEIFYTAGYDLPATASSEAQRIRSSNYLISEYFTQRFYYSYARGIKTGYTANSGYSIVTTGSDGNINLLCIVSGCESKRLAAGEYDIFSYSAAKELLRYGFKYFEELTVLAKDVAVGELPVSGGDQKSVVVAPITNASIALPTGYSKADIRTELSGSVSAPARKGEAVGTAALYYRDIKIAAVDVAPIRDVLSEEEAGFTPTESILEERSNNSKKHFSFFKFLIIVLVFIVLFYAILYLYGNLKRRKKLPPILLRLSKSIRRRKKKKKSAKVKKQPHLKKNDDELSL